jgi:hypothetical protein
MITEKEYLEAIRIVVQYTEQVKEQTEKALYRGIVTKTPKQIAKMSKIPVRINTRLWTILVDNFIDVRLCDISKYDFLRTRNAGKYNWAKLCQITGKE